MWLETDIKLEKAHGGYDRVVKALDSKLMEQRQLLTKLLWNTIW